jgi:K+-transporting ATPase ATPase C chain
MRSLLRTSFAYVALCTLLFGVAYPALVTVIAHLAFPGQAEGSLIVAGQAARGSRLIGQPFSAPGHLWSRPSATGPFPYNAAASSGSNLGPSNPALREAVRARVAAVNEGGSGPVPVDLVTASGSGLDPDISAAAAEWQVPRIARTRNADPAEIRRIIARHTEGRLLGLFGEPRVNVLAVNLDPDSGVQTEPR